MTPIRLAEVIKSARPLPGAQSLMYLRTYRTHRPVHDHRVTFRPTAEALDPAATREVLSTGVTFDRIPPESADVYALVVNAGGDFHTVDELIVERESIEVAETWLRLALTRVECTEGEPAPVDVFLILPLTPEIAHSGRVRLTFSVSQRSSDGRVSDSDNEIPDCVVPLN